MGGVGSGMDFLYDFSSSTADRNTVEWDVKSSIFRKRLTLGFGVARMPRRWSGRQKPVMARYLVWLWRWFYGYAIGYCRVAECGKINLI